jgi:hypothetical protein
MQRHIVVRNAEGSIKCNADEPRSAHAYPGKPASITVTLSHVTSPPRRTPVSFECDIKFETIYKNLVTLSVPTSAVHCPISWLTSAFSLIHKYRHPESSNQSAQADTGLFRV